MNKFKSLQDAYVYYLDHVLTNGQEVSPRENNTLEVLSNSFFLENPRSRLLYLPSRKWSIFYALGEFIWHLAGSDSLSFISYYSKSWNNYSEDNFSIRGSCYGKKIFSHSENENTTRWQIAKELLIREPDSRRIVIPLFTYEDLENGGYGKDVACTCFLQFIVRESKLNLVCFMRSNDMFVGFPYDVFFFTMLQEFMSIETGYELGWYQHNTTSSHIYEKHWDRARDIILKEKPNNCIAMPPMSGKGNCMTELIRYEKEIRENEYFPLDFDFELPNYHESLILCLLYYKVLKNKDKTGQQLVLKRIHKHPWLFNLININSYNTGK
jgi:thymidylate synthase